MTPRTIKAADLFCGASGTGTGLVEACHELNYKVELTGWNHWDVAIATSQANHPYARHFCASIDNVNPRDHYREGELDILWASPECIEHSNAKSNRPMNEQSRATAFCVARWAEALRPPIILVENVRGFLNWAPLDSKGRPIASRRGEIFHAWIRCLQAIGYRVEWRILCAADYGDPTIRERLFIYAVRGRRKIVWPDPSHTPVQIPDMFVQRQRWLTARDSVIDWSVPGTSIFTRKRPLRPKTLDKIREGLEQFAGKEFLVCMEHGGRVRSVDLPVPTITTARGGAIGIAKPFLVEYYGNGGPRDIDLPVGAITTRDRYGLAIPKFDGSNFDVEFRMFTVEEYARAQGFNKGYVFCGKHKKRGIVPNGNNKDAVKQIGNAVPKNLAKALVKAALTQSSL